MKGSLKLVILQLVDLKKEIEEKQKKFKQRVKFAAEAYKTTEKYILRLINGASK